MSETFDTIRARATRTPFALPVRVDAATHEVVAFPTGAPVAEPRDPPAAERASYAAERQAFAEQRRRHNRTAAAITLAIVLVGPLLTVLITGLPSWPV